MLKNHIIFGLFLLIQSYNDDGIIRIPLITHSEVCFSSKYGPVFYSIDKDESDDIGCPCNRYLLYKFDKIKNLELLHSNLSRKINIETKKEIASFCANGIKQRDGHNNIICELFYQTKYIDKKIFSIGKNLENEPFKYFGGTPKEIIKHTNKFTFDMNNSTVSKIEIIFKDKNKDVLRINPTKSNKVEFIDNPYLICLTPEVLEEFKKLFLNQYEKYKFTEYDSESCPYTYNIYKMKLKQMKTIPEIKFRIGNITISLNKEKLFRNLLYIQNTPCANFVFGLNFLEKFQIREYDLENNEINLYLDKNKNFLTIENETNLQLNSYSYTFLTFIILLFMISATILIYFINYPKFKNFKYLNYCEI